MRHYVLTTSDDIVVCFHTAVWANLPNRYSALWQRPVTHAQTWASYSALYRFGRLSAVCLSC